AGAPAGARGATGGAPAGALACEPYAPPPAAAERNPHGIRLADITGDLAVDLPAGRSLPDPFAFGAGVAAGDLDGDGDVDFVVARNDDPSSPAPTGPTTVVWNDGAVDGVPALRVDSAVAARFAGVRSIGAAVADVDGDGDLDVFVANRGPDVLLENDGAGGFVDVTAAAGVAGPAGDASTGAVWADVNADGLLDLYVLSFVAGDAIARDPALANRLYLQRPDRTFVEVAGAAGAAGLGASHAALIADLDGDAGLEIYVADDTFAVDGRGGTAVLDGDAVFDPLAISDDGVPTYADRAADWRVDHRSSSMGLALADLDGDGFDDLYVADFGVNRVQLWDPAFGGYRTDGGTLGLAGSPPVGVAGTRMVTWGVQAVDLDRDGRDEVIAVNGDVIAAPPGSGPCQHDAVFRRLQPGYPFADVSADVGWPAGDDPCGAGDARNGRGFALADFDGDGDLDLVIAPYAERYRFVRNDTPACGRTFVRVRLRGTVSAPDPVGAELAVVTARGEVLRRVLYGGGQPYSQGDRVLEIGLDGDAAVARAEVRWPSGLVQRIDDQLEVGGEVTVVEPRWLWIDRRVADLGDPAPVLAYEPVDEWGAPLGAAGAGRDVRVVRSDGGDAEVVDRGDGTYVAALPHPAEARTTVVAVVDGGAVLAPRLTVLYR
ncbi:MAG: hypothetical protein D6689_19720, partial [Deltaproteobacteria bacterium]